MLQHPSMLPGHPGSQITVPLSSLEALQPVQSIPTGEQCLCGRRCSFEKFA